MIKTGRLMNGTMYNGQTCRPSRCSQYQAGFVFGERPRKSVILKA